MKLLNRLGKNRERFNDFEIFKESSKVSCNNTGVKWSEPREQGCCQ